MDPITGVGLVGAALGVADVVTKTLKSLVDLQTRYRNADLTVSLVIGQLSTIKAALDEISIWVRTSLAALPQHQQLVQDLGTSLEGCRLVIKIIDGRLEHLNRNTEHSLSTAGKVTYLWEEHDMNLYSNHLNNQINALHLLLTALQCRTVFDQRNLLQSDKSRHIIDTMKDDTSSLLWLRDSDSVISRRTAGTENSIIPEAAFDFDEEFDRNIFKSKAYRTASHSLMKQTLSQEHERNIFEKLQTPSRHVGYGKEETDTVKALSGQDSDLTVQVTALAIDGAPTSLGGMKEFAEFVEFVNSPGPNYASSIPKEAPAGELLRDMSNKVQIKEGPKLNPQLEPRSPLNRSEDIQGFADFIRYTGPDLGMRATNEMKTKTPVDITLGRAPAKPGPKIYPKLDTKAGSGLYSQLEPRSPLNRRENIQHFADWIRATGPDSESRTRPSNVDGVALRQGTEGRGDLGLDSDSKLSLNSRDSSVVANNARPRRKSDQEVRQNVRQYLKLRERISMIQTRPSRSSYDYLARRKNAEVEEMLHQYRVLEAITPKVLLLGISDSGKSTLLKAMRLHYYGRGVSGIREWKSFTQEICQYVSWAMHNVIDAMKEFDISFDDLQLLQYAQTIHRSVGKCPRKTFLEEVIQSIRVLWENAGVRECHRRLTEDEPEVPIKYFFDAINRIGQEGYIPTTEDILRCPQKSSGFTEFQFATDETLEYYVVHDASGTREGRRIWINMFNNAEAVLYTVDASAYDMVLREDDTVNRMQEALMVWKSIFNSKRFATTKLVLIFTKNDIFERKLITSPMQNYFLDYHGGSDAGAAREYLKNRFLSYDELEGKDIKVYFANLLVETDIGPDAMSLATQGFRNSPDVLKTFASLKKMDPKPYQPPYHPPYR